jgi:hypothetical protein
LLLVMLSGADPCIMNALDFFKNGSRAGGELFALYWQLPLQWCMQHLLLRSRLTLRVDLCLKKVHDCINAVQPRARYDRV